MADITVSIAPGRYAGAQTVTITFPPDVRRAIITEDDRVPVLTEVLAYDQGPIEEGGPDVERPFWAVTQDGKGNVVYDGGFPKYTNEGIMQAHGGVWPAWPPGSVSDMSSSAHYLMNVLDFIADPRKTSKGNRNILLLGNSPRTSAYNIYCSHYNPIPNQPADGDILGFKDTFDGVAHLGNWNLSFHDLTDSGGTIIDLPESYFEPYAAVVFIASNVAFEIGGTTVSEGTASALAEYRSQGGGLMIVTDHAGRNYTDMEDAIENGNIFVHDATRVAKHYGAYFSGNVDREPVLVSEIKRQIGLPGPPQSHPLLKGMADTDLIQAGGSESLTIPTTYPGDLVDHTVPWSKALTSAGDYRINVLTQLNDGTIITRPLKYTIINPSDLIIQDKYGRSLSGTVITYKEEYDYTLASVSGDSRQFKGEVLRNNNVVGFFTLSGGVMTHQLLSGYPYGMEAKSGDVVAYAVKSPFEYTVSFTLSIPAKATYATKSGTVSQFISAARAHPYYNGTGATYDQVWAELYDYTSNHFMMPGAMSLLRPGTAWVGQPNLAKHWWSRMAWCRLAFTNGPARPILVELYADEANREANQPTVGSPGDVSIVYATNTVYYWNDANLSWVLHPQTARNLYGLSREVIRKQDGSVWIIQANATVPK